MVALSDSSQNHIIPLDFASVRTVPDSHLWPDSGVTSDQTSSLPIIDLSDPNATKLVFEACEKWGAFQLKGHGIPARLMEEVEVQTKKLFCLEVGRKVKALRSPGGGGGYGRAMISPFFPKHMWHEGYTIMGSATDHAKLLWPNEYHEFCEIMDDYQNQMKALIERLIHIILKSLNINPQQFNCATNPSTALQLNSYPPCPNPNQAMGLAQHTDTSLITILQAHTDGLQIFRNDVGSWIPVRPLRGALTVNIGDFLHIISNGRFVSVLHRVVSNSMQRYSVAFFYGLPSDFVVSPILRREDLGDEFVARYRGVTAKEFVDMKAKHLDRALSLLEI